MNDLQACPNCEAMMNEGETCPECCHDDGDSGCECQTCAAEREKWQAVDTDESEDLK